MLRGVQKMSEEFLFVEKYRPRSIPETILPERLKLVFNQFVENGSIPNLILAGASGCGKTTVARALCESMQCDYIVINGSMDGNIGTLRDQIANFASSVALTGGRKYVILDEADFLNPNSTQPALRNFIEEFSLNCGFIFTCNYKNKIIPALHSRCSVIDFTLTREEKPKLAGLFFKRVQDILNTEGVVFEPKVVAAVINKYFPDFRRVLNELQMSSSSGTIDTGSMSHLNDADFKSLIDLMKTKNYTAIREWVAENVSNDSVGLFRSFYDYSKNYFKPNSIPVLVITLAKYMYQGAFCADAEINLLAFITEILIECEFV
jgi:DNA polymerase III delta prime subunit